MSGHGFKHGGGQGQVEESVGHVSPSLQRLELRVQLGKGFPLCVATGYVGVGGPESIQELLLVVLCL